MVVGGCAVIDTDKWTLCLVHIIWVELSLIFILFGIWYLPYSEPLGDSIGVPGLSMLIGSAGFMLLAIQLLVFEYQVRLGTL